MVAFSTYKNESDELKNRNKISDLWGTDDAQSGAGCSTWNRMLNSGLGYLAVLDFIATPRGTKCHEIRVQRGHDELHVLVTDFPDQSG